MPNYEKVTIVRQEQLTDDVFSLWLQVGRTMTASAKAGQFINVYCPDSARLLPRPISICDIDIEEGMLRLVYRIAGKGTEELSKYKSDDILRIMGPLGNGFPVENAKDKKVILMAGGIGVPPMLILAKKLEEARKEDREFFADTDIVLGYRDKSIFLVEDFLRYGRISIATEDGSLGYEGNVIDCIRENGIEGDIIYACGPLPMLRAVKKYAAEKKIEAYISMEERMACGIGACLSCVCQSTETDAHSMVKNKRVCKEGPVFRAEDIV